MGFDVYSFIGFADRMWELMYLVSDDCVLLTSFFHKKTPQ